MRTGHSAETIPARWLTTEGGPLRAYRAVPIGATHRFRARSAFLLIFSMGAMGATLRIAALRVDPGTTETFSNERRSAVLQQCVNAKGGTYPKGWHLPQRPPVPALPAGARTWATGTRRRRSCRRGCRSRSGWQSRGRSTCCSPRRTRPMNYRCGRLCSLPPQCSGPLTPRRQCWC